MLQYLSSWSIAQTLIIRNGC